MCLISRRPSREISHLFSNRGRFDSKARRYRILVPATRIANPDASSRTSNLGSRFPSAWASSSCWCMSVSRCRSPSIRGFSTFSSLNGHYRAAHASLIRSRNTRVSRREARFVSQRGRAAPVRRGETRRSRASGSVPFLYRPCASLWRRAGRCAGRKAPRPSSAIRSGRR